MSLTKQKILGISITTNPKTEILEYIQKYLDDSRKSKVESRKSRQKPLVIVTPNPEQVVYSQKDSHFADLLNGADIAIPDGIGLVIAERLLGVKSRKSKVKSELHKISGVELMEDLVVMAAEKGFPIALIGGRTGVALKALECLQTRFAGSNRQNSSEASASARRVRNPGLKGWAEEPGELSNTTNTTNIANTTNNKYYQYCRNINQKIRVTETRIVFVGLGAPKQEYFIERLSLSLRGASVASDAAISKKGIATPRLAGSRDNNGMVFMSVGGAFDEISGHIPRAPMMIDRLGLKWLWRLAIEPWRIKRQFALLKFVGMVARELIT